MTTCDRCGVSDLDGAKVEVHRLAVDHGAWELDACPECWRTHYKALIRPLVKGARKPKARAKPGRRLKAV